MITPDRAAVALATMEDVFTPEGDAVVIVGLPYCTDGVDHIRTAEVAGGVHTGTLIPLSELTARENTDGGAE